MATCPRPGVKGILDQAEWGAPPDAGLRRGAPEDRPGAVPCDRPAAGSGRGRMRHRRDPPGFRAVPFSLPSSGYPVSAFRPQAMLIAWTTVATLADASRLARGAVEARLAACVQVDGPVTSHYRWEGRIESAQEYRLMFKFLPEQAAALEAWIWRPASLRHARSGSWSRAEHVSEKYLSWARGTSTPAPSQKQQPPA